MTEIENLLMQMMGAGISWVPPELLSGWTSPEQLGLPPNPAGGYVNYGTPGTPADWVGDGTPPPRNTVLLPEEYWPSEEAYNRVAEMMLARGITPPPRGTLDNAATQELGRAIQQEYDAEQNSAFGMGSPGWAALFNMGGAAAGGAFANGGAGYGAAVPSSTAATTAPYVASGPVTVSAIPGVTAGTTATGAAAGAAGSGGGAVASGAGGILDSSGAVIPGTAAPGGDGLGGLLGNIFGGGAGNFLQTWGPLLGGILGAIDANNQPDSMTTNQGGTSTSTYGQNLPTEITGPANDALASLRALFSAGAPVAGTPGVTNAAVNRLSNLGSNPFANGGMLNTVPTASGFATGGISNNAPVTSMFAGGQQINPYLDMVFNTAADSTQNRLATEFAHAGRVNSGSHQQARSQELQNLAAGIYGPGFEAERGRQYGAAESGVDRLIAQMEGNLGRQYGAQESALSRLLSQTEANLGRQYGAIEGNLGRELSSIYPMLQAGDMLRGYDQQSLDAPWLNMQRYMTGIQGLLPFFPGTQTQNTEQTGSVTNPLFSNPMAGFLGGSQLARLLLGA